MCRLLVAMKVKPKTKEKNVPFQHLVRENASMLFDFCGFASCFQSLLVAAKSLSSFFLYIYTRFVLSVCLHSIGNARTQDKRPFDYWRLLFVVYFEWIENAKTFCLILFFRGVSV